MCDIPARSGCLPGAPSPARPVPRTDPDLQEFIKRTGDFAVMIGLSLHGKSVLGVVHAPAQLTPKTYYAVAEKGSFVLAGGEDQCGEGLEGSERIR